MDLDLMVNDRDVALSYAITTAQAAKEIYCIGLMDNNLWGVWPYSKDEADMPVDQLRFILPRGEVVRLA